MRQRITNSDKRPVGMGISGCERASEFEFRWPHCYCTDGTGLYSTIQYSTVAVGGREWLAQGCPVMENVIRL